MWETIKTTISNAVDAVVNYVTGIPSRIYLTVSTLWDGLKDGIKTAKEWVGEKIDQVVGFVTGLPARISTAAAGMWDGIKNAFRSAINWIIDAWNGLEFKIPGFDPPGPGPKFGGFTLGVPDIPRLHSGGVFNSGAGEGLALLRDGEGVFTPEQMAAMGGAGGVTIEVTVNVAGTVIAERDLIRAVVAGANEALRRGQVSGLALSGATF